MNRRSPVYMTERYVKWVNKLKDRSARQKILLRVDRLVEEGNPGDSRALSGGIIEMKINYGPGYRVYYAQQGKTVVILLAGGDKSTQSADILVARKLLREAREDRTNGW